MALLRSIKSNYFFYHHQKLDVLVAVDAENSKLISKFRKRKKGEKNNLKTKVEAYKFIMDEEFGSLKIDFSQSFYFDIADLTKTK